MVNYETDSHESLTPKIIKFLTSLLIQLEAEGRLCGDAGSEIVFVYGYKGTFATVKNKFKTYISLLKSKKTLTAEDRKFLQERADLHGSFEHPDQYPELAKKAHRDGNMELFFEYLEKSEIRRKHWHDTKQCLCFCNR